ncbi:MAG TPA: ABC transporter ATP-binding protein [Ferruginibacter sp.]|nr:ABC transporter ATP-binding protein [Ferruginibacter sp.]
MTLTLLYNNLKPYVRPYRRLVIATLILTAIGSFAAQVNALILRYTVDHINGLALEGKPLQEGFDLLIRITIVLLAKELVNAVVQFGQKFYGEKLRIYVSRDLAQDIVEKILSYRMAFYTSSENDSGKLQTRIDRGIESLTKLVQNFFIDILPLFANAVVALVLMFNANVYVGLVGICIVPVYFYISQLQAKRLGGFRRRMKTYRENKSSGIISIIDAITVIKSFVREKEEAEKQYVLQKEMTENQMQTRRLSFIFDGAKSFIEQIGVVIIIILTSYLVLKGDMTIGAIMFHILLFTNVTSPIRQLHRIYDDMNDAMVYSEGFFDIMDADRETELTGNYIPEKITGRFEVKNVDFHYPNGTKALEQVTTEIEPGKITALVGLSGAGKSTLINLLDKFYSPSSGEILLDGIPLHQYDTRALRSQVGLVLQKNHIFKGNIAENIGYGKPGATTQEIEEAAKKAYIHEQVMQLPNQYQSEARLLSGGQQQRIAIARLFLKDPSIIFLDEPTASLDAIATEQIKNSLDAIKKGRTVIIISHSISQIIDADKIIVMEKGRVVEQGDHETVYDKGGTYKKIFDAMAHSLNIEKIAKTMNE